jgi:4-azaleucine resistance transporter AzlC
VSRQAKRSRAGIREGARTVLPFCVAVVAFGISFGLLARSAGIGPLEATIMSGTTFAGSAQFAAAGILSAGGAVVSAITAAILLNARYAAIGISVAPALGGAPAMRFLLAQLVVDESWAIAHLGEGRYDRGRLIGAGLVLYVVWVSSTAIGALGANVLGDPETLGLDAAFPALFLGLLWPQMKGRWGVLAAALGALIALALVPLAPPGVPIIVAAAASLVGLFDR